MRCSFRIYRLARGSAVLVALVGVIAWSLASVAPAQASSGPTEVQTEPAEATANGVLLKGELNPGGLPTTYYFEYASTTCDEGCKPLRTAVAGPLTGSALQEVPPVEVTDLTAGERYWYQIVASNADGTREGELLLDFTAPAKSERPTEVQTEPAEATANGVLLKGELNPGGLPTTYYFEYASTTCDEGCKPLRTAVAGPLTGSALQEVPPVEVTDLTAGERYWYQIVASNADGTREGELLLDFTAPAKSERPTEVQTEPDSKSDSPALLIAPPTVTSPPGRTTTAPTPLTSRARKLANALTVCARKPTRRRTICDRRAHMRYGAVRPR